MERPQSSASAKTWLCCAVVPPASVVRTSEAFAGKNPTVVAQARCARSWASTIAANSPLAVRATKRTLAVALEATFDATLGMESLAQAITQESEDADEGWAAFQEKRPPRFLD